MKSYQDYVKLRENSGMDVGANSIGNTQLSTSEEGGLSSLYRVIQIAWSKYRSETSNFLGHLANKDEEIKKEMSKLDIANLTRAANKSASKFGDVEEVVPPDADRAGDVSELE